MNGDVTLRVILLLVCLSFLLRAASAMCADAAREWYRHQADVARYNTANLHGFRHSDAAPAKLPEKPWYVRLHEWGHW